MWFRHGMFSWVDFVWKKAIHYRQQCTIDREVLYIKWDKTLHFPTKPRSTQSIFFLSVLGVFVGNQSVQIYPVRSITIPLSLSTDQFRHGIKLIKNPRITTIQEKVSVF